MNATMNAVYATAGFPAFLDAPPALVSTDSTSVLPMAR
jgi:hypothetical protein